MMMLKRCLVLSIAAVLAGCQTSGEEYQADVFDASQVNSQQEATITKTFDQYDNKNNVDGFNLLLYYNDHPYLLPGVVLQKNNAKKESIGGDATHLTIDWTYQYNSNNVPSLKTGNILFLTGPEAGHTFITRHSFTYY